MMNEVSIMDEMSMMNKESMMDKMSINRRVLIHLVILSSFILLFMAQASAFQKFDSDWSQFQCSWNRSGVTFSPAPINSPGVAWTALHYRSNAACGGDGLSVPPVIAGDLVYTFDSNGTVRAFDKNNGETVWRQETVGGPVAQLSTPAYGDGKLFVASNSGDIFIFDAYTGEKLNEVHVSDGNFECPVTYFDHRIYFGEGRKGSFETRHYYCYDESGNEIWNHSHPDTAGFVMAGASVAGNFIIYPVHEGSLFCLYRENGTLRDEIALNRSLDLSFAREDCGSIQASVNYRDGYVYTTSGEGDVGYVWKIGFDEDSGYFLDQGWSRANGYSSSTPAVYGGKVYVGQGEHGVPGNFSCLDDASGAFLWNFSLNTGVRASPAVSVQEGHAYVYFTGTTHNGSLYCLNESGGLCWEFNNPLDDGYISQGAAVSDGKVYFGTDAGMLYCIRVKEGWPQFHADPQHTGFSDSFAPNTGRIEWGSEDLGAIGSSSPVVAEGKVFVNCGEKVKALDELTGVYLGDYGNGSAGGTDGSWASPCYHSGNIWCGRPESVNGGTMVADGMVFESDWDGHHYFCTDEESGEELWNFTVEGNAQGTAAYLEGMVFLTSWEYGGNGHVYCVDAKNGSELWNRMTEAGTCGSPAVSKDFVYVTTYDFYGDGEIYALYTGNGSVAWRQDIKRTDATPAIAYGNVYVAGGYYDFQTCCFNATTGNLLWNTSVEAGIGGWTCSPAVADGKVFVGSLSSGDMAGGYSGTYALDAFTGDVIWNSSKGGASPAVCDGMLFTIGEDGKVYAFKDSLPETLKLSRSYPGEESVVYYEGDSGTFTATSSEPAYLAWYLDGELFHSESYVLSSSFSFDSAELGVHNLTVTALNDNGTARVRWNWTVIESPVSRLPAPDTWYQFHKDAAHSGFSNSYAPNTANLLWVSENIGAKGTSPVVAEGKVFVNCGEYVKALNEFTGEYLHPACPGSERLGSWASPCYHNGTVRCGRPESVDGGSMVADGKVFESDWDGHHYFCTDEKSGEEFWNFTVEGKAQGVPAYSDGRVFLTSYIWGGKGHVYCVDADTGSQIWHTETEYGCGGSASTDGDRVYVSEYNWGGDGAVQALNVSSGETVWRQSIKRSDSTPAFAYGNVYVAGGCVGFGELQTYCFNASTGELIWVTEPERRLGDWKNSVAVADGKVFVGETNEQSSGDGWGAIGLHALDAFSGEEIWSYPAGGESPAVSEGMVFTIAYGRVYAFGEPHTPKVYLEINNSELDFGSLSAGQNSTCSLNIKNSGNCGLNVRLEVGEESGQMFDENLFLDSRFWNDYFKFMEVGQSEDAEFVLAVPETYSGNENGDGKTIFWVDMA